MGHFKERCFLFCFVFVFVCMCVFVLIVYFFAANVSISSKILCVYK